MTIMTKGEKNLNPKRKKLSVFIIIILLSSIFLTITNTHSVRAQSNSLFSDDFDTNQPNSQFTLGSNDVINSSIYDSPTNSLQVSSQSVPPFSHANFNNVTGQIYVKIFYETNNTGYSSILQLRGETAYIGVYQDQNGIIFDWDYGSNDTHVLLSPNTWYNVTLSLYLDPNHGSNSSATLWLNGSIIASQEMPQLDGYDINTLIFDTIRVWRAVNRYDDIFVSAQSTIVASPTPVPTATPTQTPIPVATATPTQTPIPVATATPTPTTIPTSKPTSAPPQTRIPDPTSSPTPTATPSSTPTIPEIPFVFAIAIFLAITGFFLFYLKKHPAENHSSL